MRTLLVDGNIYSTAENFATAMLIDDGVIAWIGSEGGAMAHRDEADEVVDLAGDLIAPGFVDLTGADLVAGSGFLYSQVSPAPIAVQWDDDRWREYDQQGLAVVPQDPCRLRSRISAGMPTALAPWQSGISGWEVLRQAVHGVAPKERLTARGAFAALTRGAWRLLDRPDAGVLRVGAEATFLQWRSPELVVESPDQRIANWSTDPRAATPGLPPVEPGHPLPELVRVWRAGVAE